MHCIYTEEETVHCDSSSFFTEYEELLHDDTSQKPKSTASFILDFHSTLTKYKYISQLRVLEFTTTTFITYSAPDSIFNFIITSIFDSQGGGISVRANALARPGVALPLTLTK